MSSNQFNDELLAFLGASPTPFHAVASLSGLLVENGFTRLEESDAWNLEKGGRYFVTRNGSSIIAFVHGREDPLTHGLRLVGAHTDSPCLMVKPVPEITQKGYLQLGVEVYGGALLNPWFDRDLSIAGRVVYRTGAGELRQTLVDFGCPIATIPSLAIHLDREANQNRTVNPQTDIQPVLCLACKWKVDDFRQLLVNTFLDDKEARVLEYDLYFYDVSKPAVIGLHGDFIASARLDNLLSCFAGLKGMLESDGSQSTLLVCSDHEEVGSASACGAQGPMLANVLERLIPDAQLRAQVISRSLLVSTDNAHGIHPNFAARHDGNHGPVLNCGPVIKTNARQRYATNSVTASLFRHMAEEVNVKLQSFVGRNDMPCGSTIGPITATEVGVPTLDVGVPTFGMHSIRELAGTADAVALKSIIAHFYNRAGAPVISDSTS
jgi:aspartyl aminopeptidase